jgi:hypothetical protein
MPRFEVRMLEPLWRRSPRWARRGLTWRGEAQSFEDASRRTARQWRETFGVAHNAEKVVTTAKDMPEPCVACGGRGWLAVDTSDDPSLQSVFPHRRRRCDSCTGESYDAFKRMYFFRAWRSSGSGGHWSAPPRPDEVRARPPHKGSIPALGEHPRRRPHP